MTTFSSVMLVVIILIATWRHATLKKEIASLTARANRCYDLMEQQLKSRSDEISPGETAITEKCNEIVTVVNQMCEILNSAFATTGAYMDYSSTALQHILVCMKPFVHSAMNNAIDQEDYKAAEICKQLLENIESIINFTNNNSSEK